MAVKEKKTTSTMPDMILVTDKTHVSTPNQMDTWNREYEHWTTVAKLIGSSIVRWEGFAWCDFKLPGQSEAERVTIGTVQMLNRVLMAAANRAKKNTDSAITYDSLMDMSIDLEPDKPK